MLHDSFSPNYLAITLINVHCSAVPYAKRSSHTRATWTSGFRMPTQPTPKMAVSGKKKRKKSRALWVCIKNNVFFKPGNRSRQQQKALLQPSPIWWLKEKKRGMPRAPPPPPHTRAPPTPTASLRLICPSAVLLFSLSLPSHLSAQKVSKCQMGVVIIFNGIIFLHRNTVDLCVRACVCVRVCVRVCASKDVEGKTTKWNEIEPDIENWKWLLSTKNKRSHGEREREENLEVVLRSWLYDSSYFFSFRSLGAVKLWRSPWPKYRRQWFIFSSSSSELRRRISPARRRVFIAGPICLPLLFYD